MVRQRVFVLYQRLRHTSVVLRRLVDAVPGARALHRWLFQRVRPDELSVTIEGMQLLVDPRDEVVAAELLQHGVWEPFETSMFCSTVKPGMTVVDVGAHVGYYTLLAARRVGESGRVVAFEPDPSNCALLRRNVAQNGFADRVSVVQAAVGGETGSVTLFRDTFNLGAHSLERGNVVGADSVRVPAVTLGRALASEGVDHIDVLKVDVQGAEAGVVAGADGLLRARPQRMFIELWPAGLARFGTNPKELLSDLSVGATVSLIDASSRCLVECAVDEVVDQADPDESVNLLVERK